MVLGDANPDPVLAGERVVRVPVLALRVLDSTGAVSTRSLGGTAAQPTMAEALEAIERDPAS